jgi:hypothetical protein
MKNLTFILLMNFTALTVVAQWKTSMGQGHDEGVMEYPCDHLLSTDEFHIYKFITNKGLKLGRYDKNLNFLGLLEVKAEDKEREIIKIFGLKGKIFLLTMLDENKENFVQFNLSILDKEGNFIQDKEICKVVAEKKRDKPVPLIFFSPDSTKIGFMARFDNDASKIDTEMFLSVMDSDMNELWNTKYNFHVTQSNLNILKQCINNQGSVAISTINFAKKPYRNEVLVFSSEMSSKPVSQYLDLGESYYTDGIIFSDKSNDFHYVGLAGENSKSRAHEVFTMRVSSDGSNTISSNIDMLTNDHIKDLMNDKIINEKKNPPVFNEFSYLKNAYANDNNTYDIFVEKRYYQSNRVNGVIYESNVNMELLLVKTDDQGGIKEIFPYNRNQTSSIEGFSGCFISKSGDGYVSIQNDMRKNAEREIGKKPSKVIDDGSASITLFQNSDINLPDQLLEDEKYDKYCLPSAGVGQIGIDTFIFPIIKIGFMGVKEIVLVKLELGK